MNTDHIQRVAEGDPVSADQWNKLVDVVGGVPERGEGAGPRLDKTRPIRVKNVSGVDRERYDVVAITDWHDGHAPGGNLPKFKTHVVFEGTINYTTGESALRLAVLLDPIPKGTVGRAVMGGVVQVRINVRNVYHRFARLYTGQGVLTSDTQGNVRILRKEAGTGLVWALVALAEEPHPAWYELTEELVQGGSASAYPVVWTGTSYTTDTSYTVTVYSRTPGAAGVEGDWGRCKYEPGPTDLVLVVIGDAEGGETPWYWGKVNLEQKPAAPGDKIMVSLWIDDDQDGFVSTDTLTDVEVVVHPWIDLYTLEQDTWVRVAWHAVDAEWFLVDYQSKARMIEFTLTGDLTTDSDSSAATVDNHWDGYDPGGTCTVYNPPRSGMPKYLFFGLTDCKGVARLNERDGAYKGEYVIVELEPKAQWITFDVDQGSGFNFAADAFNADNIVGYHGMAPTGDVTVYNTKNLFQADDNASGIALLDPVLNRYYAMEVEPRARFIEFTLASNLTCDEDVTDTAVTLNDFWDGTEPQGSIYLSNPLRHTEIPQKYRFFGLTGCKGTARYDEYATTYVIVDLEPKAQWIEFLVDEPSGFTTSNPTFNADGIVGHHGMAPTGDQIIQNTKNLFSGGDDAPGIALLDPIDDKYYAIEVQHKAKYIRFSLASELLCSNDSSDSATVDDFWDGVSPGATVTVHNPPRSESLKYLYFGLSGAKGMATYDDVDDKYWITELEPKAQLIKATLTDDFWLDPPSTVTATLDEAYHGQAPSTSLTLNIGLGRIAGKTGGSVYAFLDPLSDKYYISRSDSCLADMIKCVASVDFTESIDPISIMTGVTVIQPRDGFLPSSLEPTTVVNVLNWWGTAGAVIYAVYNDSTGYWEAIQVICPLPTP